ncbi:heat shock 70 kDa protein-like [Papaver somniferum]|uniref:heat shock 70 kDa protein-like n=1 Tax=Papaver somniferum TaxID=3469 RepID=UPI000E6F9A75|nr:heat shock 70 kDa protein-like [Papaver somniferum]
MKETGNSSSMVSKNVIVIGIDLGTTYSSVGFWIGEELKIRKIPSCVAFTDYAEPVVGDEALVGVDKNPSNTVLDFKRLIGAKFSDNRTKLDLFNSPFEVIPDPVSKNDQLSVIVRSFNRLKTVSAEELLGMILKKLKQIAEKGLGLDNGDVIINAVISVPSCYNNAQRLATKVAASIAGFGASRLVNETSAIALAYGWLKKMKKSREDQQQQGVETRTPQKDEENVLIFDLGGGTLSAAVVNIKDGWNRYKVKSVAGNTHLGGKDFDDLLYRHCHRIQFNNSSARLRSKSSLRFACEKAKKDLTNPNVTETEVSVHFYYVRSPKEFLLVRFPVTQHVFDTECKELFDKCQEAIVQCLQNSGISQFHQVILVGGSTRIPRIREMLRAFCGDERGFCELMEPDAAVVQGAALQAAVWSGGEASSNLLLDGISITDVVPISLKTLAMPNLIPRNTEIPIVRILSLKTARNNQRSFCFGVHEGEEVIVEDNNLIGHFIFDGIQAAEMGLTNITVYFSVDRNGIFNVTAAEDGSRRRQLARRVINRIPSLTSSMNLKEIWRIQNRRKVRERI